LRKGFAAFLAGTAVFVLNRTRRSGWEVSMASSAWNSWALALLGGAMIGLSATVLWIANGRVAGISGIAGSLLVKGAPDRAWRLSFLGGLAAGALALFLVRPEWFGTAAATSSGRQLTVMAGAGLLVGFGTRMAGGCTSGHGVCGVSRGSPRSIVATLVFMATGAAAVFVVRHLLGGNAV
jgi:uncharacterized protein